MSHLSIPLACRDEVAATVLLEHLRWSGLPLCPRCGATGFYRMRKPNGQRIDQLYWRCRTCRQKSTVRTGTVLEQSRVGLRRWCYAVWRASQTGVGAKELQLSTGLSEKSARALLHRLEEVCSAASLLVEPVHSAPGRLLLVIGRNWRHTLRELVQAGRAARLYRTTGSHSK